MAQGKNNSASDIMSRMRDTASRDRTREENAEDHAPATSPVDPVAEGDSTEQQGTPQRARQSTVRFTIDLPQSQHRFLKQRALEENVRAASVVRELLTLLEEDARVAETVHDRLQSLNT